MTRGSPPGVPSSLAWSFRELQGSPVPYLFRTCEDEILACALSDRFLRCGLGAGAGVGGVVETCLE